MEELIAQILAYVSGLGEGWAVTAAVFVAVCAALAATLFHFGIMKIADLKDYLHANGVPVRRL